MLDLDSVLESLVEDAVDAGGNAIFEQGCGAVMQLRPLAIGRLFWESDRQRAQARRLGAGFSREERRSRDRARA